MKYGYDKKTKCLFSWDGDFRYEGKTDIIPEDAFVVDEEVRPWIEMAGCHFLSGQRHNVLMYYSAGDKSVATYGNILSASCKWTDCRSWDDIVKHIHPTAPVCVAGYVASNPAEIAKLCKTIPCHSVYVCPLVEELAAFGVLVLNIQDKEKPRRASLCVPNKDELDGHCSEYDAKLNGDGYGQMANAVRKGFPALNEIMSCPSISPFYGRVLAEKSGTPSTYLIRSDAVGRFFPHEPISITYYAATSVPVEVTNTTSFMRQSGCKDEKVNIVVSSDHIPYLPVFMNFYKVMSGKDFVGTTNINQLRAKKLPVFRYNGSYGLE
jgi:hypothetical protein